MPKAKKPTKKQRARFQDHRHTGRIAAHRHTHYRAIFLLLLFLGVFLAYFQYSVIKAEELEVTVKVPAILPTIPAVISGPPHGTQFDHNTVTLRGTCQIMNPAAIIVINRDSSNIGSTTCSMSGEFNIEISLLPGPNILLARTFNITNDAGPTSTPITLFYNVPTTPGEPLPSEEEPAAGEEIPLEAGGSRVEPAPSTNPGEALRIESQNAFLVFGPQKPAEWNGRVMGGRPGYNITADWGDGESDTKEVITGSSLTLSHMYDKMATHYVTITATDSDGHEVKQHIAAVTPAVQRPGAFGMPVSPGGDAGTESSVVTFAKVYVAYFGVVALGAVAWFEANTTTVSFMGHNLSTQKVKFPRIGHRLR